MWNVDEMKRLECLDIVFEIIFFLYVDIVWKKCCLWEIFDRYNEFISFMLFCLIC